MGVKHLPAPLTDRLTLRLDLRGLHNCTRVLFCISSENQLVAVDLRPRMLTPRLVSALSSCSCVFSVLMSLRHAEYDANGLVKVLCKPDCVI